MKSASLKILLVLIDVSLLLAILSMFCLFAFVVLKTYFWLVLLYFCWFYYDKETPEKGGRVLKFQTPQVWQWTKNYFPSKLILPTDFCLDSNKNYLFSCFPHGVYPLGPYQALATSASDFFKKFPHYRIKSATLHSVFYFPICREIVSLLGLISCSEKSLNFVLSDQHGGNIVVLHPGGAAESLYSFPQNYQLVLKNRKGFVKIALQNGAPLVPVITFGATDVFQQIQIKNMRWIQEFIKKKFGFAPVLFYGKGLFGPIGWFPIKTPLITVGKPIDVEQVQEPSLDEVDKLHQRFTADLIKLFEEHKKKYLVNAENIFLEVVD